VRTASRTPAGQGFLWSADNRDVDGNASAGLTPLRCPRCQQVYVRREAASHSSLEWFACLSCSNVWSSHPSDSPPRGLAPSTAPHLVIVDDEDAVVAVVTGYLRDYRVSACVNPKDALDIMSREPVDLLITDFRMPDVPGDQLIRRAREIHPSLPVVIVTGYLAAVRQAGLGGERVVEKPFTREALLSAVTEEMNRTLE
jgi:CheY-like chemotaxis protein